MTSIPASRSARAMIFAPRSCPSRPGFAITTRIFLATLGSLRPLMGEGLHSHELQRPGDGLNEATLLGGAVGRLSPSRRVYVDAGELLLQQCFLRQLHQVQRRTDRASPDVDRLKRAVGDRKPNVRHGLHEGDTWTRTLKV